GPAGTRHRAAGQPVGNRQRYAADRAEWRRRRRDEPVCPGPARDRRRSTPAVTRRFPRRLAGSSCVKRSLALRLSPLALAVLAAPAVAQHVPSGGQLLQQVPPAPTRSALPPALTIQAPDAT